MRKRKRLLFVALASAAGFAFLAVTDKDARVEVVAERDSALAEERQATGALQLPVRRGLDVPGGQLFAAAPPPSAPKPAPSAATPTAPIAPPLPYRYAGTVQNGAQEQVVLAKGERVFAIAVGETLDGTYRVEFVGSDRIELVYLPLGTADRIVFATAIESDARRPIAPPLAAPAPELFDGTPAQLRWVGPARVQAGMSFSVTLRVSAKDALRAAPMQIRYEPGVLEPLVVQAGTFFREGSFSYKLLAGGSIFIGAAAKPAAPATDAELLIVTFKPLKRGATAEVSMSALNLQGPTGRAIAHEQPAAFRAAIH